MALLTVALTVLCLSVWSVQGQGAGTLTPVITSSNILGNITANTAVLQAPLCYFKNVNCTSGTCFIYLVPAINSGVSNFDNDKSSPSILSLSPYPTAFSSQLSKNYFLTKVGSLEKFICQNTNEEQNFRVGSDGNCTTPNCNGGLPTGSTVRFKYIVLRSPNVTLLEETGWSQPIGLVSPKSFASINEGLAGRSPSMISITVILSVAMFLLLLIPFLLYWCRSKPEPTPALTSLRFREYHMHHPTNPTARVNPAFEGDMNHTTGVVLPATADDLGPNSLTLRRSKNIEFSNGNS